MSRTLHLGRREHEAGPCLQPEKHDHSSSNGRLSFEGFSLSLTTLTEVDAERFFVSVAEGGKVLVSLTKTFFSPRFGLVADRFGVSWMTIVAAGARYHNI
jgi:uncharacterized glyoxalase superfamily protein PhnB